MSESKTVLLLPGPSSVAAAEHYFGAAYEYASYLTDDFLASSPAYITNGKLKPYAGRAVLLWQAPPRVATALSSGPESVVRELLKLKCHVSMIAVSDDDDQYDPHLARVIDLPLNDLLAWAKQRKRVVEAPPPEPAAPPAKRGKPRSRADGGNPKGKQIDGATGSVYVSWQQLGLACFDGKPPHPNLDNLQKILAGHPDLSGRIWYDEFHEKVFQTLFQDDPAEWADHHDTRLAVWIQRRLSLPKVGHQLVRLAVEDFAREFTRNEPREWMDGLTWDHRERLPTLFSDAFGTPQDDYNAAVGRCWLVSMVARTYDPGCKVDTMPVFEGSQGLFKSTALSIIGGRWFAEMHEDITSKDFLQNLRGKLLIEISELHAFRKADVQRIKGIISCATDRYRAPYDRRAADHPRRSVWAGTTNEDNWVQDDTGARRFWPVACSSLNLDYLRQYRDQFFAEAVVRYKAGESWWDIDPGLAKEQQDLRREPDQWTEAVLHYCEGLKQVTASEILANVIDLPLKERGRLEQMRVASILKLNGWKKIDGWLQRRKLKYWVKQ